MGKRRKVKGKRIRGRRERVRKREEELDLGSRGPRLPSYATH